MTSRSTLRMVVIPGKSGRIVDADREVHQIATIGETPSAREIVRRLGAAIFAGKIKGRKVAGKTAKTKPNSRD